MSARCVGIFLLASASLPACIFSPNSLPYLEQQANLIVVGTASGVYRPGTPSVLSLEIGRVVKGDSALAGQTISVSWTPPQCFMTPGEFPIRGTGIWFFQRVDSGWTLIPVTAGDGDAFFPAPPGPILSAYDYAPTASLDDKLAAELCSAIESATREEIFQGQPFLLESDRLDELKSPTIPLFYRRMSGSTLPRQRIVGLGELIRSGSTAALTSAIQSEPDFARYKNENGILLGSIASRFRAADPDSIRVLGDASDSVNLNPGFREAVAHALASIHTKDTLPYLAALLYDPLSNLRAQGVLGLASFANNLPIPSGPSFSSVSYPYRDQPGPYKNEDTMEHFPEPSRGPDPDEAIYLPFWKEWWLRNRASLGY